MSKCCLDSPICDFCHFYDFGGDDEGVYVGNGECQKDGLAREPEETACDDFKCRTCEELTNE